MQGRCPRCNGTGHGPSITHWSDRCELCLGSGAVDVSAKSRGLCTTPGCDNDANPWSFGRMCDRCVDSMS